MAGVRSSKTVDGVVHNYLTLNGKVVREEYGKTVLEFVYDADGAPYALRYSTNEGYSWTTYYYLLNLQGDVVKLLYADGTTRAEYTYGPWGNLEISSGAMADINPLRYRGYYYDSETGFYYLQSRYYDPQVGRFISADSFASTGQGILGTNMFAYCNNNPIVSSDKTGGAPRMVSLMVADTGDMPSMGLIPPTYYKTSGIINGQKKFKYSGESIGVWGTYANQGCTVIAIYNALQLCNQPSSLGMVQQRFDEIGGSFVKGIFGGKPWKIDNYFETYTNLSCMEYSYSQDFTDALNEGDVFIITIYNEKGDIFKGMHTIAGQYSNGMYTAYNRYSDITNEKTYYSLSELLNKGAWYDGYIIS